MRFIINIDEEKYITSLTPNRDGVEVPQEIYDSEYLFCYKYDKEVFILDEEKQKKQDIAKTKELRINELKKMLVSQNSEYGDWKNMKQLDTGEYTEEEMAEYRAKRQEIREEIRKLEE